MKELRKFFPVIAGLSLAQELTDGLVLAALVLTVRSLTPEKLSRLLQEIILVFK